MKEKKNKTGTRRSIPVVAIIGRPNVGKSSLFNRLIHKRLAVTHEIAGTTRDRIYYHIKLDGIPAVLVDTGGLDYGKKENIEADVQSQAHLAIEEADLILFVVDLSEELTANDFEAAMLLRKSGKDILLIGNKCDHPRIAENAGQFLKLGFGEPVEISTIHKIGLDELQEIIAKKLRVLGWKKKADEPKEGSEISLCFLGRPNAGKSSIVNALLGKEKLIVSPIPGTTRDAVDTGIEWHGQAFNLIDTAGLRRRGKIESGLEKLSTLRSLEAVERSDVICLIIDYEKGVRKQDLHISSYAVEGKKGLMLAVNKSDLMKNPEKDRKHFIQVLRYRFDFLPWVPVIFISALKKQNIEKILELAGNINVERMKRIDNDELDGFMKEITYKHIPPKVTLTEPKIYSLEQTGVNPPTFVFWVNDEKALHFSYRRYLENEIRKKYNFTGTAIRLIYKSKFKKD